jgi:hypothetical protein
MAEWTSLGVRQYCESVSPVTVTVIVAVAEFGWAEEPITEPEPGMSPVIACLSSTTRAGADMVLSEGISPFADCREERIRARAWARAW